MEDDYPRTAETWAKAIDEGLGLKRGEGRELLELEAFPYRRLDAWISGRYALVDMEGVLVSAWIRNIRGLVDWVYGNGPEPDWSASDD